MSAIFEYASVRVIPRVDRGEFINVGVILYSKTYKFLKVQTELNEARLEALAPTVDLAAVRAALQAFGRACTEGPLAEQTLGERFRWLTAPRSAIVQPGPVHAGITTDPAAELATIPGRPPEPGEEVAGCAFAARCAFASDRCRSELPSLLESGAGHRVACWHPRQTSANSDRSDRSDSSRVESEVLR